MMLDGSYDHGMRPEQIEELRRDFDVQGHAFAAYPGDPDYGIAVAAPAHVVGRLGGLRLVNYTEASWAAHQDTIAVTRPA